MTLTAMHRNCLKGFVFLLAATLVACANLSHSEDSEPPLQPVQVVLPTLPDALDQIDQAAERVVDKDDLVGPELPADFWAPLVERFELDECTEGSTAQTWARWYADRPDYMDRVFRRAGPWLPDIANEIKRRELAGELIFLPIVESAYDPFAYSRSRAAGSWQFLEGTGEEFGLEINDWYDGRRDVYAATRAALDYMEYLADRFGGEWTLALASYNAGQGRVSRALARAEARGQDTSWNNLRLPRETLGYVPKMKGLGCLFANPESYGFELPRVDDRPQFAVVSLPGPTDVVLAAKRADLDVAELVALNPGLNRHMTPPNGPHYLIVPARDEERVAAVVASLEPSERVIWNEVEVRSGDTLSGLATRHDVSIGDLREHNNLNGDLLSVGQILKVPSAENGRPEDPAYATRYRELTRLQQRLLPEERFQHQVRPGESLWVIARRYNVSVDDIRRWNDMGGRTMIRPGQRLQIRKDSTPGQESIRYTVRSGDSLWVIARRHQVAVSDLLRWNDLSRDSTLRPGQELTIRRGSDA